VLPRERCRSECLRHEALIRRFEVAHMPGLVQQLQGWHARHALQAKLIYPLAHARRYGIGGPAGGPAAMCARVSGSCHLGPSRSDISNVACSFRHWRRAGWCAAVELTAYQNKVGARLPSKNLEPLRGQAPPHGPPSDPDPRCALCRPISVANCTPRIRTTRTPE
jgi:hypothetical protein